MVIFSNMNNDLENYITSYFGIINKDELHTISSLFNPTLLNKGDFFLKINEQSNELSFIQSGLLRIFTPLETKDVTQWICTPGEFITELSSFLFNTPSKTNIQALTSVKLYTITKEDYDKLGHLVPKWHQIEKLFMAKCFTILEDRIFSFLSMSAEERYQLFFQEDSQLLNQVPLQYLASMLGMTPETFSRIRKKLLLNS